MKVFACYNIKGGVGKTAAAVNLGYLSARAGARTLVWDLDPQGAATYYFRVRPKSDGSAQRLLLGKRDISRYIRGTDFERLDLLRARFAFRNMDLILDHAKKRERQVARLIKPLAEHYDHLFFDCPPGITLTSESIFVASEVLLVPTIPTTLSLRALVQLERHLRDNGPGHLAVCPFFSMVDRRKKLHREICEHGRSVNPRMLSTAIPYASQVERMGVERAPVLAYAPRDPGAVAYEALWEEIGESI